MGSDMSYRFQASSLELPSPVLFSKEVTLHLEGFKQWVYQAELPSYRLEYQVQVRATEQRQHGEVALPVAAVGGRVRVAAQEKSSPRESPARMN